MRHIPDTERRARLARRHALAPGHRAADPEAATRAVTVLHSTEPATVYLSLWARVDGVTVADVDSALYDDRSLVK
ncbi:MAG TPA: crosslink repair DNA glycosylase YcaQ family protein, partial [Nocardioides sp.]|nr:crosslink repair DNA glycosylase YcaQ family protein [Nocardioides sp.]